MEREIAIREITGVRIGQAENAEAGTGCTVFICENGMRAGLDVRGGGPASRESDRLHHVHMEPWEKASAAIGYARYDAHEDRTVSDVFHRADKTMYECKMRMKQGR